MNARLLRLMLPVLLLTAPAFAQDATTPAPGEKIDPKDITATLVADKAAFMPGEPFYVSFVVKNNSTRDLLLWEAFDLLDTGEASPQARRNKTRKITLAAASKEGVKLPEYDWMKSRFIGYGENEYYRAEKIPPSGSHTFRVFVAKWVVFAQPGNYTLTAESKLVFSIAPPGWQHSHGELWGDLMETPTMIYRRPPSTSGIDRPGVVEADKSAVKVPVTATTDIEVTPPDQKKMDDLAGELLKQAAAGAEAREAADKLLEIPDERVIPWLLGKLKDSMPKKQGKGGSGFDMRYSDERIDVLHALAKFNNDAALAALKSVIESELDAANGQIQMERGLFVHYLLESPHPGAIPYLLTLRDSPDEHIRYVVADTLGTRVPPAQAIPLLKKMAHDRSSTVSYEATYFLKQLSGKNPE